MSKPDESISAEAAEKAYEAAAAEAVAKTDAVVTPAPLAFPAKEERVIAPKAEAPALATVVPVPVVAEPVKAAPAAVPAAKKSVKKVAAPKMPAPEITSSPIQSLKETIMTAKTTTDFTKTVKGYATEAQAKAKAALAKGSEAVSEVTEFTKGNVDAVVTSGKILGAGLQGLGKTYAAEGKAAFETVTADVKAIAAVKSPVEFVQTQSTILRKNFDHAIDFNAKTGETMLKLFGEVFAPLTARANLVVSKVKKAA